MGMTWTAGRAVTGRIIVEYNIINTGKPSSATRHHAGSDHNTPGNPHSKPVDAREGYADADPAHREPPPLRSTWTGEGEVVRHLPTKAGKSCELLGIWG